MKVIFLGRKPFSCKALKYLLDNNVDVLAVVAQQNKDKIHWTPNLADFAKQNNIPLLTDQELYKTIDSNNLNNNNFCLDKVDLVISYLFWKKIKQPLIKLPKIGCINFHPAPLPDLRGLGGYNIAIYEDWNYYGVSAHFVDETFDTGDIIQVKKFEINPQEHTAYTLEQKSQQEMFELFKEVINTLIKGEKLNRIKQSSGRYITKENFESLRKVDQSDTPDQVNRKIRAFWYPPFDGAYVTINNCDYTLVNSQLLKDLAVKYHNF